jgi:ABC-type antimicrobial peptide transport system permease subunit
MTIVGVSAAGFSGIDPAQAPQIRVLAIGLASGVPAAIALGRYVSSQLYGIKANDPWIAMGTMMLLTVVSAAAGLIPAHRASRVDPILALRYE